MLATLLYVLGGLVAAALAIRVGAWLLGVRYIPHGRVGVIEKKWSTRGSLTEGRIIALCGEAGFQGELLRGGIHAFFFPWQYRIHREPLVIVGEGRIGYVYARDGAPLPPTQTLGRIVASNDFQDARAFLGNGGQRGRQRAILREGVYAVNLAQFVVITEERVYNGPIIDQTEETYAVWQAQLFALGGFSPVVIGTAGQRRDKTVEGDEDGPRGNGDCIGVVTVMDGQPIKPNEIIAPEARPHAPEQKDHDYFQDPEAFLALGGCRGKQLQVLTDGTFYINRWFATVAPKPKTVIPIGYVGVVVSYYGSRGQDLTGENFRYGEQVEPGQCGVWKRALPPGKYALNPYAMTVEYVPTTNFVLRWITGSVEVHQYDKDLTSIEMITADGYEPTLPLSLVLHIDYEKAPSVVQRFGDVKRLISQTLDPILSAYFRDVAQGCNMLDLLTRREEIQARATEELGRRFRNYDINCVAVLIGRPESNRRLKPGEDDPIDRLFDQLRIRRLATEQVETFELQQEAARKLRELNEVKAIAEKQAELTQTHINIEVSANKGEAQLAEARRLAQRDVVKAEAESRSKELVARGEGQARELVGKGEASRIAQVGLAEAAVSLKKVQAFGDPRLLALQGIAEKLAASTQPLVPERLFVMGGEGEAGGGDSAAGLVGRLMAVLLSEKLGLGAAAAPADVPELERFVTTLVEKQAGPARN